MEKKTYHWNKLFIAITIVLVLMSITIPSETGNIISKQDIIGTYISKEGTSKVRIFFAMNNKYSGKIIWLKDSLGKDGVQKKDIMNPDDRVKERTVLNAVVMRNFEFNEHEQRWEGGTIYDPKSGKTFSGYLSFGDNAKKELILRGYIYGIPFLGRSDVWTRIN